MNIPATVLMDNALIMVIHFCMPNIGVVCPMEQKIDPSINQSAAKSGGCTPRFYATDFTVYYQMLPNVSICAETR